MNETDVVILQYLSDISPSAETPTHILWNIHERRAEEYDIENRIDGGGFTITTCRNRLERLQKHGLVEVAYDEGGYRAITDLGLRFLAGETDPGDLDDS